LSTADFDTGISVRSIAVSDDHSPSSYIALPFAARRTSGSYRIRETSVRKGG
jgi:hypothetical protein